MLQTCSIHVYDHFDLYLTPVTVTFNLPEKMFQMTLLLLEDKNSYCAKLFLKSMHKCKVMARTSSIYIHFDLYLTPVTLTFNLPEKNFQMALLLLEGNLTPMILTLNLHEKMFQMALLHLKGNNCGKLF